MQNLNNNFFSGYIEGYYGKILSWEERLRIIHNLNKNNMKYYFYAPKEDYKHRVNWKLPYENEWGNNFELFTKNAHKNDVKIIAGIAPGLNFDFKKVIKSEDYDILLKKSFNLIKRGADYIALMFDDIPNNFNDLYGFNFDEGRVHAELANKLAEDLNFKLILVPRVYAHELNIDSPEYLISFGKYINNEIPVFHCGEKIVTRNINKKTIVDLKFYLQNKIIFWDNLYANDYCPRRLFICPWIGRSIKNNIMINPTGMIETDLLILDIIAKTPKDNGLFKVLEYHGVPKEFYSILDYFKNPVFQDQKNTEINCSTTEQISAIDYLLWEWKTSLSIEWYTYLMGLKQDILISTNQLPKERIIKTQNTALCKKLLQ